MSPRHLLVAALSVVALGVRASAAEAEGPAGRIVHVFDFEERDDGNYEDLPMHFSRVGGIGLPHWVRGRLTTDAARGGEHSFRIDLNGGSGLYRTEPGVLPTIRGARYRVAGYVRTTPLRFARARLTAYCVDADGEMLPNTVRQSPPFASKAGDEGWYLIEVTAVADDERAAGLVIELGLLQPGAGGGGGSEEGDAIARDALERFRQDVAGSAWFDDLTVSRVPTVRVGRDAPGGIFLAGEPVRLWAEASDPRPGDLAATCVIRDAVGRLAWRGAGVVDVGEDGTRGGAGGGAGSIVTRRFAFEVPPLPAGWYKAEITVGGSTTDPTAGRTTRREALVVLADATTPRPDARFTADASHLATDAWQDLPAAIENLAAGRVMLSVWGGPGHNDAAMDNGAFDAVAQALTARGVKTTAVFAGPTPELALAAGGDSWEALLPLIEERSETGVVGAEAWRAPLAYFVSRHAHAVDRWQVGRAGDAETFAESEEARRAYAGFSRVIRNLMAGAATAVPWPARQGTERLRPLGASAVELRVPADVTPRQIPLYVADAAATAGTGDLSLLIEPLDADVYGRTEHLGDLARRVTYALASGVGRVTVPLPYQAGDAGEAAANPVFEPTETYLALRTLFSHLSGLRYVGRVPVADDVAGVEAFLFAGRGERGQEEGVIVTWSPPAASEWESDDLAGEVELHLNLHDHARQVDLWGRSTSLSQNVGDRRSGRARVRVGPVPTLIAGVDAGLTRLRQTVGLDQPFIESSLEPHARRLRMTNTFDTAVSGTLLLRAPAGWDVALPATQFALDPGETLDRPVVLRIPYNADAGRHRIEAQVRLQTQRGPETIVVPIEVNIGLSDVGLRTLARREGGDLVVEQTITNYGTMPVTYSAFVMLAGRARQERLVVDLGAGESSVKAYRFPGAAAMPPRTPLRSGLRELEGTRVLNDRLEF